MNIYCCQCKKTVKAKLTNGSEIYPHRKDLYNLPFWKCNTCSNFVGCHYKTKNRTRPLGVIANPEIRNARKHLHKLIDPLWKGKRRSCSKVYKRISDHLGYEYHTAELRDIKTARKVYKFVLGEFYA